MTHAPRRIPTTPPHGKPAARPPCRLDRPPWRSAAQPQGIRSSPAAPATQRSLRSLRLRQIHLIRDLLRPLVETALQTKSTKLLPKDLNTQKQLTAFTSLHGANSCAKSSKSTSPPSAKPPVPPQPPTSAPSTASARSTPPPSPKPVSGGYNAGFLQHQRGGRCETCKGAGRIKLEMNFMPDTHVTCEDRQGRRYGEELSTSVGTAKASPMSSP